MWGGFRKRQQGATEPLCHHPGGPGRAPFPRTLGRAGRGPGRVGALGSRVFGCTNGAPGPGSLEVPVGLPAPASCLTPRVLEHTAGRGHLPRSRDWAKAGAQGPGWGVAAPGATRALHLPCWRTPGAAGAAGGVSWPPSLHLHTAGRGGILPAFQAHGSLRLRLGGGLRGPGEPTSWQRPTGWAWRTQEPTLAHVPTLLQSWQPHLDLKFKSGKGSC